MRIKVVSFIHRELCNFILASCKIQSNCIFTLILKKLNNLMLSELKIIMKKYYRYWGSDLKKYVSSLFDNYFHAKEKSLIILYTVILSLFESELWCNLSLINGIIKQIKAYWEKTIYS